MEYINRIRANVREAINIRKFAQENGVKYSTLKIYNMLAQSESYSDIPEDKRYYAHELNRAVETARDLAPELLKSAIRSGVELPLIEKIQKLILESGGTGWEEIFRAIGKYANKEYLNEFGEFFDIQKDYGEYLYEYIIAKSKVSLDEAIARFDSLVEWAMEHGVSERAAVIGILYFNLNFFFGGIVEKAYLDNNVIKDRHPSFTVRAMAERYAPSKEVHGMTLVSCSEEGLNKLVDYVELACQQGAPETIAHLSSAAKENNLLICDFGIEKNGDYDTFYDPVRNYIAISEHTISKKEIGDFFHETTHFLDQYMSNGKGRWDSISSEDSRFREVLAKIEARKHIYLRGVSLKEKLPENETLYINNPTLNNKWLAEIKLANPGSNDDTLKQFLEQRKLEELEKYRILSYSLQDIYDGISGGRLSKVFEVAGHGEEYFSNKMSVLREFIAAIGEFYNCGGEDILVHEFGYEIAAEIIGLYQEYFTNIPEKQRA